MSPHAGTLLLLLSPSPTGRQRRRAASAQPPWRQLQASAAPAAAMVTRGQEGKREVIGRGQCATRAARSAAPHSGLLGLSLGPADTRSASAWPACSAAHLLRAQLLPLAGRPGAGCRRLVCRLCQHLLIVPLQIAVALEGSGVRGRQEAREKVAEVAGGRAAACGVLQPDAPTCSAAARSAAPTRAFVPPLDCHCTSAAHHPPRCTAAAGPPASGPAASHAPGTRPRSAQGDREDPTRL